MEKLYSYFGMAARGDRSNLKNCRVIVGEMEKYSKVLTRHLVYNYQEFERDWTRRHPRTNLYQRDIVNWLRKEAKRFVADVTGESMGVGAEIVEAHNFEIPSLLFSHVRAKNRSTMWVYFTGADRRIELTLEQVLTNGGIDVPIVYYTDENIHEIAEREIRNFFTSTSTSSAARS